MRSSEVGVRSSEEGVVLTEEEKEEVLLEVIEEEESPREVAATFDFAPATGAEALLALFGDFFKVLLKDFKSLFTKQSSKLMYNRFFPARTDLKRRTYACNAHSTGV